MLIVCVDYSSNSIKVYGLIAIREENLKVLASFLPMFPHYSEIRGKIAKSNILKAFPKRYSKVVKYIEELVISTDFNVIVRKLEKLKGRVKIIYSDIHVYKRTKRTIRDVNVVSENKKLLKRKSPGVLTAFNILDLAMNQYRKRRS